MYAAVENTCHPVVPFIGWLARSFRIKVQLLKAHSAAADEPKKDAPLSEEVEPWCTSWLETEWDC